MHVLTDEEYEKRTQKEGETSLSVLHKTLRRDGKKAGGRKEGDGNIPSFLRPVIGALARNGNGAKIAEVFGVSQARASQLSTGRMGASPGPIDTDLKAEVDSLDSAMRGRAIKVATLKLMASMNAINEEKLGEIESPVVLSTVARNLAGVIKSLEDKDKAGAVSVGAVYIHAPIGKSVSDYDIIDVQAKEG